MRFMLGFLAMRWGDEKATNPSGAADLGGDGVRVFKIVSASKIKK